MIQTVSSVLAIPRSLAEAQKERGVNDIHLLNQTRRYTHNRRQLRTKKFKMHSHTCMHVHTYVIFQLFSQKVNHILKLFVHPIIYRNIFTSANLVTNAHLFITFCHPPHTISIFHSKNMIEMANITKVYGKKEYVFMFGKKIFSSIRPTKKNDRKQKFLFEIEKWNLI